MRGFLTAPGHSATLSRTRDSCLAAGIGLQLLVVLIFWIGSPLLLGQHVYIYIDNSGVRVLTNLTRSQAVEKEANEATAGNFQPMIREASREYGIDPNLVAAIIRVESDFNPHAVSDKNCRGLMQLHPETARRMGVTDIFDPQDNILGGVRYLSFLIDEFGPELDHVLAAYNAGENAVRRFGGVPPYSETQDYVVKVKQLFNQLTPSRGSSSPPLQRLVDSQGHILLTNTFSGVQEPGTRPPGSPNAAWIE